MSNQTTAVVKKKEDALSKTINSMAPEWAKVLPINFDSKRFTRMAISCLRKNPKLAQAFLTDQGRISTLSCLSTLAEIGLEADGRRAHLIPFKDEITLVIDYKGLVELVMRSGLVSNIHADKICKNDKFKYNMGEVVCHEINFEKPRGDAYAYYCIVKFKDGTTKCEVMQKEEVEKIRLSSPGRNGDPWTKWYDEMAKKTVFKRLSKWLTLTPAVSKAIEHDDQQFIDIKASEVYEEQTVPITNFEETQRAKQIPFKTPAPKPINQPKTKPVDVKTEPQNVDTNSDDNLDF